MSTCAFEWVAGSVTGRDHVLFGRANQDAWGFREGSEEGSWAAVVCDGCGSAERSEVGAWVGAGVVLTEVLREQGSFHHESSWRGLRDRLLASIREVACRMGETEEVARACFLFTFVGAVCRGGEVALFSIGDGCLFVNGALRVLGPFDGNAPPYLGHGLFGEAPEIVVHDILSAREVQSLGIGTDGAAVWPEITRDRLPASNEVVGPLFDGSVFAGPDLLRRKLARMNQKHGLLRDDTTLWLARPRAITRVCAAPHPRIDAARREP